MKLPGENSCAEINLFVERNFLRRLLSRSCSRSMQSHIYNLLAQFFCRLVLSAVSDYFAAMFTNDVREAKQEEIKMEGVDPEALRALVHFAYTGEYLHSTSGLFKCAVRSRSVTLPSVFCQCAWAIKTLIYKPKLTV